MANKDINKQKKAGFDILSKKMASLNNNQPSIIKEQPEEYKLMQEQDYEFVDYELIDPNPDNDYPINGMDMTIYTIEEYGLFHNLVLCKTDNGRYKIISGERRYLAIGEGRNKCIEENKPIPVKYQKILAKIVNSTTLEQKIILELANLDTRKMSNEIKRQHIFKLSQLLMKKNELANSRKEKVNIAQMIAGALNLEKRQVLKYNKINKFLITEMVAIFDKGDLTIDQAERIASHPIEYQYQIWDIYKDDHNIDIGSILPDPEKQKELIEKRLGEEKLKLKRFNEEISDENTLSENELMFLELQARDLEKQVKDLENALTRLSGAEEIEEMKTGHNTQLVRKITNTYKKIGKNVDEFKESLGKNVFDSADKEKMLEELDKAIEKLQDQKELLKS